MREHSYKFCFNVKLMISSEKYTITDIVKSGYSIPKSENKNGYRGFRLTIPNNAIFFENRL